MLMLHCISLKSSPLEGGLKLPLTNRRLQNGLEFSLEFRVLLTKLPYKHFVRLKFKICGFYVKYNTRLKYNNTTPFFLNNYLLKCVQPIPDSFSTGNLSIHYKILKGLKDQFGLRKLLQFF